MAFPLGLLLALGRRSSLPAIRLVTVGYIEAFRAVPLVTLLFLGGFMVGFLFPNTAEPPSLLVRAVIVITVFEAAYIAEIVRGGLRAVPHGQVEAAQALGLSPSRSSPGRAAAGTERGDPRLGGPVHQPLQRHIPLSFIGFLELWRWRTWSPSNPPSGGTQTLRLSFLGLIFWAGCSSMSARANSSRKPGCE